MLVRTSDATRELALAKVEEEVAAGRLGPDVQVQSQIVFGDSEWHELGSTELWHRARGETSVSRSPVLTGSRDSAGTTVSGENKHPKGWMRWAGMVLLLAAGVLFLVSAPAVGSLSGNTSVHEMLEQYLAAPWPLRLMDETHNGPHDHENTVISMLLLCRVLTRNPNPGYVLGQLAGSVLWPGLLLAGAILAWRFLFKRKRWAAFIFWSSVALLAWSSYKFSTYLVDTSNKRLLDEILRLNPTVLEQLRSSSADPTEKAVMSHLGDVTQTVGVDKHKVNPSSGPVDSYGQYAGLVQCIDSFASQFQCDVESANAELGRLGLYGLLSSATFGSASALTDGRRRLRRAEEVMNKYEALADRRVAGMDSVLAQMNLPQATRREVLAGFRENAAARANTKMRFELQRRIFSASDSLLAFMLGRRGTYTVSEAGIVFASEADISTYDRLLASVSKRMRADSLFDAKLRSEAAQNAAGYRNWGR